MARGDTRPRSHDDGEPRQASRRRRRADGAGDRGEPHARRYMSENAKQERGHDATPDGTRNGTGSVATKQAEADRMRYGRNARIAGEVMRMSRRDAILNCKD